MSNFQSGVVPQLSVLKLSPEGAQSHCSGIAGFAFPWAENRDMSDGGCPVCPGHHGWILTPRDASLLVLAVVPFLWVLLTREYQTSQT